MIPGLWALLVRLEAIISEQAMVGERSGTAVAGIESARRAVFRHPWISIP